MAWYEIEYKCGHKDRMQLYGPYTERNRRIEWYKENVICPDCRAAKQKEEAEQQKKEPLLRQANSRNRAKS